MQNTTNYNLKKPDGSDFAKIEAINENTDIIDTQLKVLHDNKANSADLTTLRDTVAKHLEESANFVKYKLVGDQSIPSTQYTSPAFVVEVNTNDFVTHGGDGYFVINDTGTYRISSLLFVSATTSTVEARILSNNTNVLALSKSSSSAAADTKTILVSTTTKCNKNDVIHIDFAHYDSNFINIREQISHIVIEKVG